MKRYLNFLIIFFLLSVTSMCAEVTLAWDASPSTDVTGYRVYDRDYTHSYGPTPIWQGPELTATVTIPDGRQVAFVCTAYKSDCSIDLDGNATECESGYSNEVVYIPEITPPSPPHLNWVQKVIAAIANFFGGFFNA